MDIKQHLDNAEIQLKHQNHEKALAHAMTGLLREKVENK